MKSTDLDKIKPDLSHLDDKTQREIEMSIQRIYEIHTLSIKELRDEFEIRVQTSEAKAGELVNGLAINLIGDKSQGDLQTLQQTTTLTVNDIPNLPTSKITTGEFIKDRLHAETAYSDFVDNPTPDTPITGYIEVTDRTGTTYKLVHI